MALDRTTSRGEVRVVLGSCARLGEFSGIFQEAMQMIHYPLHQNE